MKKLLIFSFMFILLLPLNSAEISPKILDVVFNLENAEGDIEFGFSKNEIKEYEDEPITFAGDKLTLSLNTTEQVASTEDSFYVWYKITGTTEYEMDIYLRSPLVISNNNYDEQIDWFISIENGGAGGEIKYGEENPSISDVKISGDTAVTVGSFSISLSTERLVDTMAGEYSGNLVMKVTSIGV